MSDLYSKEAEFKRKQFNSIIRSIDMVLMNNTPEVDPSVYENWLSKDPMTPEECRWFANDSKPDKRWCCAEHLYEGDEDETTKRMKNAPDYPCPFAEDDHAEIYQWFAVSQSDAEFLNDHNQHVTYSDMLDTHFLAICHFGTAWDYTSMVDDFSDLYTTNKEAEGVK